LPPEGKCYNVEKETLAKDDYYEKVSQLWPGSDWPGKGLPELWIQCGKIPPRLLYGRSSRRKCLKEEKLSGKKLTGL
jgi:hypothetical protein